MKPKKMLIWLNWFYFLEINQYELYKRQQQESKDDYIKKVLDKFATIEKEHAKKIKKEITNLGGTPTKMGNGLGRLLGSTAGSLTSLTGTVNLFRINLTLERRAIKDYRRLIKYTDSKKLQKLLWSNLIEEDLHHSWFAHQKEELQDQIKSQHNITES
ncbi:bacterioferritin (cytochrome b1) [Halobacteroides halobius DSM 5150]|uniref:Bacterioferritin (Cytochrome b1) n=1 Tax=Halobacteroides halobius (strain ATCC 35273 / DSM 5150 / MD-1) TaxID=748449 RepID=L0K8V3_HALHC|nr:ferritin-like domain-containing protein [Halobacteroides halobius]AGB41441.1 bacterioferritin (cytochrome b1) [Halobacteroides halobius DSM 5150]